MLHFWLFHSRSLALAIRLLPLNNIHIKQSILNSSVSDAVGCRNWSMSLIQLAFDNLRTVNTIAPCQRLSGFINIPCPPLKPDENRAVRGVCCISLLLLHRNAIALFDHLVPLKSFVAVAGVIAFFSGITSVLFVLGRGIQFVSNLSLGKL